LVINAMSTIASAYAERIKNFEGYSARASWDYAQHSNGYGTRAAFPGEIISRSEAERRFADEISAAAKLVDRFAPQLEPGARAALTSLTHNAGTRWMSSGLGQAIRRGDMQDAKDRFLQYTKAGGDVLPGLVSRRQEEVTWFGSSNALLAHAGDSKDSPRTNAVTSVAGHDSSVGSPLTKLAEQLQELMTVADQSLSALAAHLFTGSVPVLLRSDRTDQDETAMTRRV
jgi:lysozyme